MKYTLSLIAATGVLWSVSAQAASKNDAALAQSVKSGDFSSYLTNTNQWLQQKLPPSAKADEAKLKELLKDAEFVKLVDQSQFITRMGADKLGAYARGSAENAAFVLWVLNDTPAMDQYLEAMVPVHLGARAENKFHANIDHLPRWQKLVEADADAKSGVPMRIAIATAIRPPGTGAPGAGQQKTHSDPLVRYQYFKSAHQKKELFPSFDKLSAWDMQYVVSSGASEADLTWGRQMINTWRPDLRKNELVVNSTSEVWRRNSPIDFANTYKNVLAGGGKCGPRSSWSVFICQAFGIPAIGVGQPAHACVAYRTAFPMTEPQPGYFWKVGYGAGWHKSKLEGMGGVDFIAGVQERERRAEFSAVEHLRWFANALAGDAKTSVMAVANAIQLSVKDAKADLTASHKAEEAEKEIVPVKVEAAALGAHKGPIKINGSSTIEASAFSGMLAAKTVDCFTGGKQVILDKNQAETWIEYAVDAPAAGPYLLQLKAATPNEGQFLDIVIGEVTPDAKKINLPIPNSYGLWNSTTPVELNLAAGVNKLRFTAPFQRGVAIRHLEIKPKG